MYGIDHVKRHIKPGNIICFKRLSDSSAIRGLTDTLDVRRRVTEELLNEIKAVARGQAGEDACDMLLAIVNANASMPEMETDMGVEHQDHAVGQPDSGLKFMKVGLHHPEKIKGQLGDVHISWRSNEVVVSEQHMAHLDAEQHQAFLYPTTADVEDSLRLVSMNVLVTQDVKRFDVEEEKY